MKPRLGQLLISYYAAMALHPLAWLIILIKALKNRILAKSIALKNILLIQISSDNFTRNLVRKIIKLTINSFNQSLKQATPTSIPIIHYFLQLWGQPLSITIILTTKAYSKVADHLLAKMEVLEISMTSIL